MSHAVAILPGYAWLSYIQFPSLSLQVYGVLTVTSYSR